MSYSAIGKVVKIFDEHGLYHIDISDDQIWYWSIKISENLSIFFHQCNVVFRKVLYTWIVMDCFILLNLRKF